MAAQDQSHRDREAKQADSRMAQRLAGEGAQRAPQRMEMGGDGPTADATLRPWIAEQPDDDGLNAEQHR